MSNRPDAPADEYERGSTSVSRAYRALPDEGPPSELDEAILAKARAAAVGGPVSKRHQRWRRYAAPAALAATLVMAIGVALEVSKQPLPLRSIETKLMPGDQKADIADAASAEGAVSAQQALAAPAEPAVPVVTPAPFAPTASAPRVAANAPQSPESMTESAERVAGNMSFAAIAPAPPPPQPSSPSSVVSPVPAAPPSALAFVPNRAAEDFELRKQQISQSKLSADNGQLAEAIAVAPAEAKSELSDAVQRDPAQWFAAIQALREAGDTQAADRESLAFRKAWPNYPAAAEASSSQTPQPK